MSTEYSLVLKSVANRADAFDKDLRRVIRGLGVVYPEYEGLITEFLNKMESPLISVPWVNIGHTAMGWRFCFAGKDFKCLSDVEKGMRTLGPEWVLRDEYGKELTFDDFKNVVLSAREKPHVPSFYMPEGRQASEQEILELLLVHGYRTVNVDGDHITTGV